jgi:hypothetical protein
MITNKRLYATGYYNRKIGMLRKEDYIYMRECLEHHLDFLQSQTIDKSIEIDELKVFFIKLDHTINRL